MVPIRGPFTKTLDVKGAPIHTGYAPTVRFKSVEWSTQKPPYTLSLPFKQDEFLVLKRYYSGTYYGCPPYNSAGGFDSSGEVAEALNKCYSKLVAEVHDYSQWANNILESRKTYEDAADKIGKLVRFTGAVRKFQFSKAAKILGIKKPRGVSRAKQLGDNWLAYHFGWEPLVQDIGSAVKSLAQGFHPRRVRTRAKATVISQWQDSGTDDHSGTKYHLTVETKCQMICLVRATNPNANLLNELGFVNPASVLWDAVPFSFVVDWLANVGQVLSSYTDFVGVEVSDACTTLYQVRDWNRTSWGVVPGNQGAPVDGPWFSDEATRSIFIRRSNGIAGPVLNVKPFHGFSVVRGATGIAVLLQFLK